MQPTYRATRYGVGGPVGPQDIVSRKKIKKFKSYPQKNIFFFLSLWDNNIKCNHNKQKGKTMTNYALLQIDKYKSIEWGVNVVFQTNVLEVARAMKLVKENASDLEIKERKEIDADYIPTPKTFQIIELDS